MAKFMFVASYTAGGTKGLIEEGGSARRAAVEKMVGSLGGSLEAFYYGLGADDVYVIAELPSDVDAAAASMTVGAGGAATIRTVALLSPEEIDEAAKKSVDYRPAGA